MKTERNWKFDYIKGIACIIVICLHCPLPGKIGEAVIYGCRVSVPLFFIITGYYCETKSNEWILRKTKDLLIKTLIAELLYGIWSTFLALVVEKQSISDYVSTLPVVKRPIKVLFCGSMFNGIFWYLYAAIWAYLFILLLRKIKIIYSNPICIILIAILVCVLVIGRYIVQNTYDIDELAFLFCNALVFGLPMLLTGMLLSRYEERITKSLSLCVNILILVVGLVVMVIEFIFSGQYMDFHFSTYILSCAVFMFAFTYKRDGIVLKNALSYTGRRLSLWIYLDHIFVNSFLNFIEESTGIKENQVVTLTHPFLVILLSVLMAFAIDKIKSRNRVKNA